MSSQNDGLLQTNQSFHYNREKNSNYKVNSIDAAKFTGWQKDHMYKSSYANFHSRVLFILCRVRLTLRYHQCQSMVVISHTLSLRTFMPKDTLQLLNNVLLIPS